MYMYVYVADFSLDTVSDSSWWQDKSSNNILKSKYTNGTWCTVELLTTDPPRSDHPLYNGQPLWNGLNLP